MSGPNGDPNISADDGIIEDEDEFSDEEYAAIDSMLDQINSCLDDIEEKNDSLNGKLHELLESNRQARRDFREQLSDEERDHPHPPEEDPASRDTQTRD
ncbi:UPF0184 protein C9orf16 homolog [Rhinichthys klamathensis goyatoka]|uniref:UPF0184 protein C9orf16 homolog n=1 Tax=Rhinichthys klamathensis goyatoka TaxID=3034132 RepID=UPI0024B4D7A1|nr:UPF0184 protein C9orf16 homolog [Rhinichthys klamathensis goyatoka]